jgi:hypothetical protein
MKMKILEVSHLLKDAGTIKRDENGEKHRF